MHIAQTCNMIPESYLNCADYTDIFKKYQFLWQDTVVEVVHVSVDIWSVIQLQRYLLWFILKGVQSSAKFSPC